MAVFSPEIALSLLKGLGLTLLLTVTTGAAALALGLLAGTARLSSRRRWRWPAGLHILIHRHVPALVIMIFWAFALPGLFVPELRRALFFDNDLMVWLEWLTGAALPYYLLAAAAGLILNSSAYIAELFRVGMGTLTQQQLDTATTLGASPRQRYWALLAPQGLALVWPAVTTRLIHNMKNTALASFLTVPEFFNVIQGSVNRTFAVTNFFLLAAVAYLLLAGGLTLALGWLGNRLGGPIDWPALAARPRPRLAGELRRLARERG